MIACMSEELQYNLLLLGDLGQLSLFKKSSDFEDGAKAENPAL